MTTRRDLLRRLSDWWGNLFVPPAPYPPRYIGPVPPMPIVAREVQRQAYEAFARKSEAWSMLLGEGPPR